MPSRRPPTSTDPGTGAVPRSPGSAQVDDYLAATPSPHRETLTELRETLRSIIPHAEEAMKYAMPAFTLGGKGVVGYAAFQHHCSYFPMSGSVLDALRDAIGPYETSKGAIRFAPDHRLPKTLVQRLLKLRIAELSAVTDGRRADYYADGRLKAAGRMKDGELHGTWEWFRRDGSLMRAGRFDRGAQVGVWTTFDRDGASVKTTEY